MPQIESFGSSLQTFPFELEESLENLWMKMYPKLGNQYEEDLEIFL